MIVLDTNVVSEFMKLWPHKDFVAWVKKQDMASFFTTSVTQAEILFGIVLMPHGHRRKAYEEAAHKILRQIFTGRILPFDTKAADRFAEVMHYHRKAGRSDRKEADAQIAAISLAHNATLATRNVRDFEGVGLTLINPWEGQ